MSTNCMRCVVNTRTKFDGLCDRCRIIDAAPDLLAACEAAITVLVDDPTRNRWSVRNEIRAAIAKARGETKP